MLPFFEETYKWIEEMKEMGKTILLHCAAGASRSASFVIACIMKSKEISFTEAFLYVKEKRPCIQPNEGFIKELLKYENILKGE